MLVWPREKITYPHCCFVVHRVPFLGGASRHSVIPYARIENDEALFAAGIYSPRTIRDSVRVFHRPVASMLMSYLGALKSWIYWPLFAVWPPSAYSLRGPVLVLGGKTLFG